MSTNLKKPRKKRQKNPELSNTHLNLYLTPFTQHPHNHHHRHIAQPFHRLLTTILTAFP